MSFGGISSGQLRSFIERIEHLEEEKKNIQDQIKDVFAEAKGNGFDPKIMKLVLKTRRMKEQEREEQDELLTLYLQALGMDAAA